MYYINLKIWEPFSAFRYLNKRYTKYKNKFGGRIDEEKNCSSYGDELCFDNGVNHWLW